MKIRLATKEDKLRIIELGLKFAEETFHAHQFNASPTVIAQLIDNILEDQYSILLIGEDEKDGRIIGFIYGLIQRVFFGKDLVAQEFAWYVEKENAGGVGLLDAFEDEAKARGAKKVVAGFKPSHKDLSTLYYQRGYSELERQFIKDL